MKSNKGNGQAENEKLTSTDRRGFFKVAGAATVIAGTLAKSEEALAGGLPAPKANPKKWIGGKFPKGPVMAKGRVLGANELAAAQGQSADLVLRGLVPDFRCGVSAGCRQVSTVVTEGHVPDPAAVPVESMDDLSSTEIPRPGRGILKCCSELSVGTEGDAQDRLRMC